MTTEKRHHVVVIGGGFGGLYATKSLGRAPVDVTLIDRRNFHLFQPLLYQVATGALSPGDIASPLRAVLNHYKNITVLQAAVTDLDPIQQKVILSDGELAYDSLIVATGVNHHYFGNDHWSDRAPGLKTIEDALNMRQRVLVAFEAAERETDPVKCQANMTFIIVGAGPTGVELAGAVAELAYGTLKSDFQNVNTQDAKVILLEGADRVLPPYPADLSAKAEQALANMGVDVRTGSLVTNIAGNTVTVKSGDTTYELPARTILWAAGMKASQMGQILNERTGVELDRAGRVMVEPDLTVTGHPNIFVIGDLTHVAQDDGSPVPGVAPAAMQMGQYAADSIQARVKGKSMAPFKYWDKGSLAVIGRNKAVAKIGKIHMSGFFAWLLWIFIHIAYLIEYDNRVLVLFQWALNYATRKRGARLITSIKNIPTNVEQHPKDAIGSPL